MLFNPIASVKTVFAHASTGRPSQSLPEPPSSPHSQRRRISVPPKRPKLVSPKRSRQCYFRIKYRIITQNCVTGSRNSHKLTWNLTTNFMIHINGKVLVATTCWYGLFRLIKLVANKLAWLGIETLYPAFVDPRRRLCSPRRHLKPFEI